MDEEGKTEAKGRTRIGFGSCHKNKKSSIPPIWETIRNENPDAFVWTGDAMYPGGRNPETGARRYGPAFPYEIKQAFDDMKYHNKTIGYQAFLNSGVEIYGTWDDHDYGGNDLGYNMPDKKERQEIFWDFLGYKPHDHAGVYHTVDLEDGRIKLILLDTRSFRQDHCIPSLAPKIPMGNAFACGTRWMTAGFNLHKISWMWGMKNCHQHEFLGEDQWEWLEQTLLSTRTSQNGKGKPSVVLIVSSVQIWTTNPAMEGWGHFPEEQKRMWNLLQRHHAESDNVPVFLLSGDVHHAEISGQSGFLEFTSSGLTHHCGQPKLYGKLCKPLLDNFNRHRHLPGEYFIGLNYGLIDVDWESRSIMFQIKTASGSTVLSYEQGLDERVQGLGNYNELPHTFDGHMIPVLQKVILLLFALIFVYSRIFRIKREGKGSKKSKRE